MVNRILLEEEHKFNMGARGEKTRQTEEDMVHGDPQATEEMWH